MKKNEGIVGPVSAEVLAVGRGARASKSSDGPRVSQEQQDLLMQLRKAVDELEVDPANVNTLSRDVKALRDAIASGGRQADRLECLLRNFATKLRLLGVVITEASGIGGILVKLGKVLGFSVQL